MGGGNFITIHAGATLAAADLLAANRRIILVSSPNSGAGRAIIELPSAREWPHHDLTVVSAGAAFRIISPADEFHAGDVDRRGAVRLIPLLSDDGPNGWGLA